MKRSTVSSPSLCLHGVHLQRPADEQRIWEKWQMGQPAALADIRIRQVGPGTPQVGSQVCRLVWGVV